MMSGKISSLKFTFAAILVVIYFQVNALVNQDLDFGKPRWQKHNVITWDVREYYAYLPATFIYNDASFAFLDTMKGYNKDNLICGKSPIGKYIGRFSIGMAVAYSPCFFLSDAIANISGAPRDGFSQPYQWGVYISGFIYSIVGFLFLAFALRRFFSDGVSAITVLCIGIGTNLFYYSTTEGGMSHATLFCLCAAILYYTVAWHQNPKIKYLLAFAFVFGLAVLIRPTLVLASLIFLLYGVKSKQSLQQKIGLIMKYKWHFILSIALLILMAIPQMVYWHHQTGSYLYYSYNGEHFFFQHPRIFKGLFSYRKGWFLYTPMMLLAIGGLALMRKYASDLFIPILVFTICNIYAVLSWWCWWYGGSFGLRAFIDSYAFLSVPLACLWTAAFKEGWIARISLLLIAGFFSFVNLFQSQQYREGMLHWDSMSKQLYWATFLKYGYVKDKDNMNDVPNYKAAMQGLPETTPSDPVNAH